MAHLHTRAGQYDFTASAFIVRTDGSEPRAVLHMHKKLGRYLQFGGHVEHHEDPWQAVLHEIVEESGYHLDQLKILQPPERMKTAGTVTLHPVPVSLISHPFEDIDHHHSDIGYAFTASGAPKGKPQAGESTKLIYLNRQQLQDLPDTQIPANVRDTFLFVMTNCLRSWESLPLNTFVA